jgi:hypothetical protein
MMYLDRSVCDRVHLIFGRVLHHPELFISKELKKVPYPAAPPEAEPLEVSKAKYYGEQT